MKMTWMVGLMAWWAVAAHGAEVQVFFGNLHSHTSFSDGSGKPDEAFKVARKAGLHFLAVTEHNHKDAERGLKGNDPRKDGILIAKTPAVSKTSRSGPQSPRCWKLLDASSDTLVLRLGFTTAALRGSAPDAPGKVAKGRF